MEIILRELELNINYTLIEKSLKFSQRGKFSDLRTKYQKK